MTTTSKDLFSIIMLTFDRPTMLKEAVDSFFRQTYKHIEIVIINNAATPETVDYLREIEGDHRIKIVNFSENQFDPEDPEKFVPICFNAGLAASTGNYIWYNADDDLIGDDFAEKMVALFENNPNCTTATGLHVAIGKNGEELALPSSLKTNVRPMYTDGHIMALDTLRNGNMFSSPGYSFVIKREALIEAGGYHQTFEQHILYGIIPFGVTGFDKTAIYYWRYHDQQLNKQLTASGWLSFQASFSLIFEWNLEKRWKQFGEDVAKEVVTTLVDKNYALAANWFVVSLYNFRFIAAARIILENGKHLPFWRKIPRNLYVNKYYYKIHLKSFLMLLFDFFPPLNKIFPRLSEKLNK